MDIRVGRVVGVDSRPTFLQRLHAPDRGALEELGSVRQFSAGELIFLQGERGGRLGLVEAGIVMVSTGDESGRLALIGSRRPGDLVGEADALVGGSRSTTATAFGVASVRVMTTLDFEDYLATRPSAAVALAHVLANEVQVSVGHRLRAGCPVPVRLAACLLDLADQHGRVAPDGTAHVDLPISQDGLAAFVDSSRDAVAKTLAVWRRQGLVETARRRIVILDVPRLTERADGR